MKNLIAIALMFTWGSASAIPVQWTLEDVVFADGGTASGSFVFDADTSTYSRTDIVTTSGSILQGQSYHRDGLTNLNPAIVWFLGGSGPAAQLGLVFLPPGVVYEPNGAFGPNPLTNSGGWLSLDTLNGGEVDACYISCYDPLSLSRNFVSGGAFGVAVPLPPAVWLFGSALAGLGWVRRKNTAA
jgi:hypothetical protein